MNSQYEWQKPYIAAILEPDNSKVKLTKFMVRMDTLMFSIEQIVQLPDQLVERLRILLGGYLPAELVHPRAFFLSHNPRSIQPTHSISCAVANSV
jgi:hypothetical protein